MVLAGEAKALVGALGPILAMVLCNYRRQLQYPDYVQIGARHALGPEQPARS